MSQPILSLDQMAALRRQGLDPQFVDSQGRHVASGGIGNFQEIPVPNSSLSMAGDVNSATDMGQIGSSSHNEGLLAQIQALIGLRGNSEPAQNPTAQASPNLDVSDAAVKKLLGPPDIRTDPVEIPHQDPMTVPGLTVKLHRRK